MSCIYLSVIKYNNNPGYVLFELLRVTESLNLVIKDLKQSLLRFLFSYCNLSSLSIFFG